MNIRILSDLHLEFSPQYRIPIIGNESDQVLILAGDTFVSDGPFPQYFFEDIAKRFRHIILILGNHEFYWGNFNTSLKNIKKMFVNFSNISVLENENIVIDGINFIGCTLWGEYNRIGVQSVRLNDFSVIKNITVDSVVERFNESRDYIFSNLSSIHKNVVITHNAPSFLSIHERYKGDPLNDAFAVELFNKIYDSEIPINLWIHGHIHDSANYLINNTNVVCNPRGYFPHGLNPLFNANLIVDIV